MKGSLRIAKIFNIPVEVHWSFLLLFVYVIYLAIQENWGVLGAISASLFVVVLFLCVVLHEFGHALMARRFDVQTRDITLYPIGGVARLESLPRKPVQEFWVAIAGPLVNIAIALILLPVLLFLGTDTILDVFYSLYNQSDSDNFFMPSNLPVYAYIALGLIGLNLTLALFNLIPAFPMDGGRVLRAILSHFLGHLKATKIAALVGQVIALYFVYNGILGDGSVTQLFIGVFVFLAAGSEAKMAKMENSLQELKVKDWMKKDFIHFETTQHLSEILPLVQGEVDREILVFDVWQNPVGTVSTFEIIESCLKGEGQKEVGEILFPIEKVLTEDLSLQDAFLLFQQTNTKTLPVMRQFELIGILEINQIYTINQVLNKAGQQKRSIFNGIKKWKNGKN
jgi:Zn-dependent protease/predicted transcriptional regulator